MVVRRVLVLIQVGLAALARDKHTPNPQLDFRNDNNAPTDARSPLSRLANLRIFTVGADVDSLSSKAMLAGQIPFTNRLTRSYRRSLSPNRSPHSVIPN